MYFTTKNKHAKTNRASVLIFGADPEGLGVALVMKQAGIDDMLIIDIREIGASFLNWHRQMFLLTPFFHSNSYFRCYHWGYWLGWRYWDFNAEWNLSVVVVPSFTKEWIWLKWALKMKNIQTHALFVWAFVCLMIKVFYVIFAKTGSIKDVPNSPILILTFFLTMMTCSNAQYV